MAMSTTDKLALIKSKAQGNYYASRTASQLGYALKLSAVAGGKYDKKIEPVIDFLIDDITANETVTSGAAKDAEKKLEFMSKPAKELSVICVSHAHIDMNWSATCS